MSREYSNKFWIAFWGIAAIFLTGWYFYWEGKNKGMGAAVEKAVSSLPISKEKKDVYGAVAKIGDYFLFTNGAERNVLVLLQNEMELRPGGGFLGAFAIIRIKDGKVVSMETHDLSNFDRTIPPVLSPPYPIKETMRTRAWKMRDSNWSPDFKTNAAQALEMYRLGGGKERFDAIVAINGRVLETLLAVTGPVELEGYPGAYDSESAILKLEYQVEKGFDEQGIERSDRKVVMGELAGAIAGKLEEASLKSKVSLAQLLMDDLEKKDIQLFFFDEELQQAAEKAGFAGRMDAKWDGDYLLAVDANLGSYKSDYYVKREMDYSVDLSGEAPLAKLKITYTHTAKQRDWMTKDYLTYLRVYVPEGSWLTESSNFDDARFGNEGERKYFGALVRVPLASSKTVELVYALPKELKEKPYDLLIQKQSGTGQVPLGVHITFPDGRKDGFAKLLDKDMVLGEVLE
ncbi:MAG TPA: DUF4012 domain-containing protein [Candidatus Moranbacteria bacterium]|nr:DUF4012 domain-containing protein [Candidatus Moranbacteria bacterium]